MQIAFRHYLYLQPLLAVSVVFLLMQFTPYKLVELSYEDLLVTHSKVVSLPSDEIVVLQITESTLANFPYRSPIDREHLSTIIEKLRVSAAKRIGVDILFDQATEPSKDAMLKKAFLSVADRLVIAVASSADGLSDQQVAFQSQFLGSLSKASVLLAKDSRDGVVRNVYSGSVLSGKLNPNLARAMTSVHADIVADSLDRIFYQRDSHGAPYKFKVYPAESAHLLPNEWFKDKYVLIGMNVAGIDQFRTPLANRFGEAVGTMPGVMIHANLLNQHLSRVNITELSKLISAITLFIAAVLGSVLILMETSLTKRLLAVGLAVLGILLIPYLIFPTSLTIVPAVTIATSFILSVLIGALIRWREDRQQQEFIKNAWARYVSPGVVDVLLANPEKMETGGERREISLIFTDIANFTTLAESLPIERLTPMLNRYLDMMSSEFLDAGATLDKFLGDGVMGFFGAPFSDPEHADKAVALALKLDKVCRKFQQELLLDDIELGRTRIGVHSGTAIVGNFGGSRFFDYTAQGNTVNTAARLEAANKLLGSSICVSVDTARLAVNHHFRPIGQLLLAGKQNLIEAWEPLSEEQTSLAPLENYEHAYRLLESGSENSWKIFDRLSKKYPNDYLVAFHLDRLNNDSVGIQFETKK